MSESNETKPVMVSQEQAELLARDAIQTYCNACHLQTAKDAANALMKLVSVAGVTMAAIVGADEAAERLTGTGEFVRRNARHMKMERAN